MLTIMKNNLLFLLFAGIFSTTIYADTPLLQLKVITTSEQSLYANLTLIMGEQEAALVDAPFTRADAYRAVADIIESGKQLKYVYITHDHPDHFFSMQVIQAAFPSVEIIAHPTVVADIWKSIPFKVKRWGPMLGNNGPAYPTAPKAWPDDHFLVDGQTVNILGPMQGDHHHATALYIPTAKTLITGDLAFQGIHVWLGESTAKQRKQWIKNIDVLLALNAEKVIAGHQVPNQAQDNNSLSFTKNYIADTDRLASESKNAEQLKQKIRATYPEVVDVLNNFILNTSASVVMGEEPPWQE